MAELEQELYGLTAKHDAVFQLVENNKYRTRKLPFTSQTVWTGNKYGREIDKIFGNMKDGKISLNQADRDITKLMRRYYEINPRQWL